MHREHTIHEYDRQLGELKAMAIDLRNILLSMLESIADCFRTERVSVLKNVIELSAEIIRLKEKLDRESVVIVSLRQPVASDLRLLVATLQQGTHLESIGRYCVNVCNRLAEIDGSAGYPFATEFGMVIEGLVSMLKLEIQSYVDENDETAAQVAIGDRDIDLRYSLLVKRLIEAAGGAAPLDPHGLMKLHSVIKNAERIGDHITELARLDAYMVSGTHRSERREGVRGVLFLCVHNARRSQLAHGLARKLFSDTISVMSAGSEPAESVDPFVAEALLEAGADPSGLYPKSVAGIPLGQVDMVIAVCKEEVCVDIPGIPVHLSWDMANPEEATLETMRELRDRIELKIRETGQRYGLMRPTEGD